MNISIDANEIIKNLTEDIANYARENAILKAQVKVLNDKLSTLELEKEDSK